MQQPNQIGLQVLYAPTNKWIPVPAIEDVYVVNIGDLLDGWTKGQYRSAVHRVVNHSRVANLPDHMGLANPI
jgi:isopenicillin N synthase-like dioxygenase